MYQLPIESSQRRGSAVSIVPCRLSRLIRPMTNKGSRAVPDFFLGDLQVFFAGIDSARPACQPGGCPAVM